MVENCAISSGRLVATDEAMVCGSAPGRLAETWMVGKSTFREARPEAGKGGIAEGAEDQQRHAISSVVMIGLLMNGCGDVRPWKARGSLALIAALARELAFDRNRGAGNDTQLAVGDDLVAGLELALQRLDRDRRAVVVEHVDVEDLRLGLLVDQPHVGARRPGIDRVMRHDERVGERVERDRHVDELSGHELGIGIGIGRAQFDRAGGVADRVADEIDFRLQRLRVRHVQVDGGDELSVLRIALLDARQVGLRQRERYTFTGCILRDDDERVGAGAACWSRWCSSTSSWRGGWSGWCCCRCRSSPCCRAGS